MTVMNLVDKSRRQTAPTCITFDPGNILYIVDGRYLIYSVDLEKMCITRTIKCIDIEYKHYQVTGLLPCHDGKGFIAFNKVNVMMVDLGTDGENVTNAVTLTDIRPLKSACMSHKGQSMVVLV